MSMLPCLSVRQPWAHFIVAGLKPIENRNWRAAFRGRVLVHASKGMTRNEYLEASLFAARNCGVPHDRIPAFDSLPRGGIVGSVEIVGCVDRSDSPWFVGEFGFVLRDPQTLPFIPYKGALGFFRVPESVVCV